MSKNTSKTKKILISILIATIVSITASMPIKYSYADPTPNPHCCGETILLAIILATMVFNDSLLYTYLISGIGDIGTGGTGTTSANAQSQMSHKETAGSNTKAHYAAVDRTRDAEMTVAERVVNDSPNPMACEEGIISSQLGARNAFGDTSKATNIAASKISASVDKTIASAKNELAHTAGFIEKHYSKYCSEVDSKAGRCSGSSKMPDADSRVQSIFYPADNFQNQQSAKQSITFTSEQFEAASDAVVNILGRYSPPTLPKSVSETPAGKMYNIKMKVFQSRISPANFVLTNIAARRGQAELSSGAQTTWNEASKSYSDIFTGTQAPSKPSEAEAMRLEVMRRFADPRYYKNNMAKDSDLANSLVELAQNDAIELKLLWDLHSRLEEDNALLAATIAQLLNPISKTEIENNYSNSFRSKN